MEYRKLGQTEMEVSTIAVGCWQFAGGQVWGEQDDRDSINAVRAALDVGINFFDTAEGYGKGYSEEVLGKALGSDRDKVIVATKVSPGHLSRTDLIEACERSLRRLQTDYIDLYQIHWPNRDVPVEETVAALNTLLEQGKIRAIGVSNFGFRDLNDILDIQPSVASNQLIYSLLWRAVEYEIQNLCEEKNVGILCYSPLAQGLLSGKYNTIAQFPVERMRTKHFSHKRPQAPHREPGCEEETFEAIRKIQQICDDIGEPMPKVALAWLLQQKAVTSVLAGVRNVQHVESNAAAATLKLSESTVRALNEATNEVKEALGNDLDFVQYRIR